eukprot:14288316-Alexandrium_andersonii.AAC.1
MPSAWDRRFIRTHEKKGLEVRLLVRVPSGDQLWVVARPDLVLTTVTLRSRAAVTTQQKPGIFYTAFP